MSTHPIIPSATKKKRTDFDLVAAKAFSTAPPVPFMMDRGTTVPPEDTEVLGKDGMTYQAIADKSGVDQTTVIRSVTANAVTQPEKVLGKDGKKYPPKKQKAIFADGGVDLIVIVCPCILN